MRRLLVLSVGLAALTAGMVMAWHAVGQEREFQRLLAAGDEALARAETYVAIEAFSGALALRRDSMLAYLKRGDAYRHRGELGAALRDLQEAAALDPAAPRPVELLGDVNAALGRHERAAEHYRAFIALDDRSARVLYKLALAHYNDNQPAQALEPLRQAVDVDERLAEAHYLLGLCLRDQGSHDEGLQALVRAVEIDPAFVAAREELAALYERAGLRRQAIEQLEALAALEPELAERLVMVAIAYARAGRTDTAMLTLVRAAERHPDHPSVRSATGRVWLETAEARQDPVALSRALDTLRPAAAGPGASSETLALYGRALLLAGNVDRAEAVLMDATLRRPIDPTALRHLADAAESAGHAAEARTALRQYATLVGEDAVEPGVAERLQRLSATPSVPASPDQADRAGRLPGN